MDPTLKIKDFVLKNMGAVLKYSSYCTGMKLRKGFRK